MEPTHWSPSELFEPSFIIRYALTMHKYIYNLPSFISRFSHYSTYISCLVKLLFHFSILHMASHFLLLCYTWSFTGKIHHRSILNTPSFHSFPPSLISVFLSKLAFPWWVLAGNHRHGKKGRGLTEIDVRALPLIRWLNPSINMQRRCPMQMDPIRRNGAVLYVASE